MTRDGSRVFFSTSDSLLAADGDDQLDLYETGIGGLRLLTPGSAAPISYAGVSKSGTHVFFTTSAALVPEDTDGAQDVYVRQRAVTTLVSGTGTAPASFAGTSNDGSRVFFTTADRLTGADVDSSNDVYERSGGATTLISNGTQEQHASFKAASADGQHVIFATRESLAGTDADDHPNWGGPQEDLYERHNGATSHVSVGDNEPQVAFFSAISEDGARVFFTTIAGAVSSDQDGFMDVYERSGGQTTIASTAPGSNSTGIASAHSATFGRISTDGGRVFFATSEALTAADTDAGLYDVYERTGGTTTLISIGDKSANPSSASVSAVSEDGSRVLFRTAEQLVEADTDTNADVYERSGGVTTLLSTGPAGGSGSVSVTFHGASADGSRVVFSTTESLVSSDTDGLRDIYERADGGTKLVSTGPADAGSAAAAYSGMSANGIRVAFSSGSALVAADGNETVDVYLGILAEAPVATAAPSLSATGWRAGETVTVHPGTWDHDPELAVEWARCLNLSGYSCEPISGTDAEDGNATYELTAADNGFFVRGFVLATNPGGTTRKVTPTSPVVGVPYVIAAPSLAGQTRTGELLTVNPGSWTPEPTGYEVQWLRCTSPYVASCAPIAGDPNEDGLDTTYRLVDADDGKRIRARVVAVNEAGRGAASTTAATVLVDKPTLIARPTVSGTPAVSTPLETDLGEWSGTPFASYTVEWLRCSTVYVANCAVIASDTDNDNAYTPGPDDVGFRIRVRVGVHNAAGSAPKSTSLTTAKVAPQAPPS